MNIRLEHLFLFGIIVLSHFPLWAQNSFQLGSLPSININKKSNNNWSINTKIESRQLFQRGEINGTADKEFRYVLTDVSLIVAKKVGLNSRLAGGYLIRSEDGVFIHRLIQQFAVVQSTYGIRLAHRFMTDQTFSESEVPDFRLRYRITSEIPLNGESVDPGEFYLKLNNEYVNSLQARVYDLEIRLIPLLGYDVTDDLKIEMGLDYRVNSFVVNNTRHSYWMTFNVFVDL